MFEAGSVLPLYSTSNFLRQYNDRTLSLFPTNQLFYPSHPKDPKPGLEKNRKIVAYSGDASAPETPSDIPDGWYLNEDRAMQVWDRTESKSSVDSELTNLQENDPLRKIDESAHRLRMVIDNFEIDDQQFVMTLIDMLDDESALETLDEGAILLEARFRLSQLIEDHSELTESEARMLDSLKAWFTGLIQNTQSQLASDISSQDKDDKFDITELATMINRGFEVRQSTTAQIEDIHRTVVDRLTRQVRELRRVCADQSGQLAELQQALESQTNRRRRAAQLKKTQLEGNLQDLANAHHQIAEQASQINSLRRSLAVGEEPEEIPAVVEAESDLVLDIEQRMAFDARISELLESVSALKSWLSEQAAQAGQLKQNEGTLMSKVQALERAKQSVETSLQTANERMQAQEKAHLARAKKERRAQAGAESPEAVAELRAACERAVADAREEGSRAAAEALARAEHAHQTRIQELVHAIESGDMQKALAELNQQNAQNAAEIEERHAEEVRQIKAGHSQRLTMMSRHYEQKVLRYASSRTRTAPLKNAAHSARASQRSSTNSSAPLWQVNTNEI
jgi:hypothetical protein